MSEKETTDRTAAGVNAVVRICQRPGPVVIVMQDSPDPDALGSAMALRKLVQAKTRKRAAIAYCGMCGRAENRAMIQILRIDAQHMDYPELASYPTICLVDVQPHTGHVGFFKSRPPDIVVDHHILPERKRWSAGFMDVRPYYGATTTILYEYLTACGIKPHSDLATAMFYGIQSDTQSLGRDAHPADIRAYQALFLLADKRKLAQIHRAPVPVEYFKMLESGLAQGVVAGATVISCIAHAYVPEMIAEVADLLIRLEGIRTSVVYGVCEGSIHLSVRAVDARRNAVGRMRRVVKGLGTGGGHGSMAGGQIPIKGDQDRLLAQVHTRIIEAFAARQPIVPLINRDKE